MHNDIIIEDFVVKQGLDRSLQATNEEEEISIIERGTPISSAIMSIYKPFPFLGLLAGAGREFSSLEDFTVIRFGLEAPYIFHITGSYLVL